MKSGSRRPSEGISALALAVTAATHASALRRAHDPPTHTHAPTRQEEVCVCVCVCVCELQGGRRNACVSACVSVSVSAFVCQNTGRLLSEIRFLPIRASPRPPTHSLNSPPLMTMGGGGEGGRAGQRERGTERQREGRRKRREDRNGHDKKGGGDGGMHGGRA